MLSLIHICDGEQGAPVQGDGAGARQIPGGQGGGVQRQRGILFHVQGAGDEDVYKRQVRSLYSCH